MEESRRSDSPKDACGVFGVWAPEMPVAQLVFDGLYALQHRGQEAAGMAVSDGETITVVKDMGLVTNVFDERTLSCLDGSLAMGHVRYSTAGPRSWQSAQPAYRSVGPAGFCLAHNGTLTNTEQLADKLGMLPGMSTSDSDLTAEMVAAAYPTSPQLDGAAGYDGEALESALMEVLPSLEGAFSLVLMDSGGLVGVRDPHGLRPLCLGELGEGAWVLASESPALDVIGARFVRELDPGEMVVIDGGGPRSLRPFRPEAVSEALCIFEFVYFARPDSQLCGKEVHGARRRMGELLAEEAPVEADLVMGVPDSGLPAAEGYARRSGIPYGQGLVKNRYIGRTFIAPSPEARSLGVRRKLNPLKENIVGRRLVVVDDSLVRGTTQRALVRMLREAGASEVHLRLSSPPFEWPCFYGIDIPSRDELLAPHHTIEEIGEIVGADSIAFLSLENLVRAIEAPGAGFCSACLTGEYPAGTPSGAEARSLEGASVGA